MPRFTKKAKDIQVGDKLDGGPTGGAVTATAVQTVIHTDTGGRLAVNPETEISLASSQEPQTERQTMAQHPEQQGEYDEPRVPRSEPAPRTMRSPRPGSGTARGLQGVAGTRRAPIVEASSSPPEDVAAAARRGAAGVSGEIKATSQRGAVGRPSQTLIGSDGTVKREVDRVVSVLSSGTRPGQRQAAELIRKAVDAYLAEPELQTP